MERMIGSNAGSSAGSNTGFGTEHGIQRHLETIRLALAPLSELAKPAGATLPGPVVTKHLSIAIAELSAIDHQILQRLLPHALVDSQQASDEGRVPCSFCGRLMMPTATLCGFCWRRRDEPATAGAAAQK